MHTVLTAEVGGIFGGFATSLRIHFNDHAAP